MTFATGASTPRRVVSRCFDGLMANHAICSSPHFAHGSAGTKLGLKVEVPLTSVRWFHAARPGKRIDGNIHMAQCHGRATRSPLILS